MACAPRPRARRATSNAWRAASTCRIAPCAGRGAKPKTGLPAAARAARYRLLAKAAQASGATPYPHRAYPRRSGRDAVDAAVARQRHRRSGGDGAAVRARRRACWRVRFCNVSKSQLIATLEKAKIGFADDPTNRDPHFTRPRLRALMPALAAEGGDARNLARLASRLARANAAVEVLVDGAERYLALEGPRRRAGRGFDAKSFDCRGLCRHAGGNPAAAVAARDRPVRP